ncbi:SDR family NAD(P)-dependent oxidoreductase [Sphingomonas sp.]|uniref:SDR family NAD(P)-dependent oxidoreductase n=1 Tax=Sphingomonas sp. TaxID=28214 RepID=UPI0025CBD475|nr:SDR family NAD(P)-dependent oxidoreductase [Sphingomonas sp.]
MPHGTIEHSAVVTGASTGIGWAACKVLADNGWRVFGSVRKQADADRLAVELGERFTPLVFDVTDEAAVRAGAAQVAEALAGRRLGALVNNAGIAVAGPLIHLPVDDFRLQLEVNLTGVVIATQAFAPLLGADPSRAGPPGRILNISSVGGKTAFPFMAPYNASKFGLEGLSEALRRELLPFGIDVIVLGPAGVRTPIWDKADALDIAPYAGTIYAEPLERVRTFMAETGRAGLTAEQLGKTIHRILTARKPRVRYAAARNMLEARIVPWIPKRLFDRIIGKQLGLLP